MIRTKHTSGFNLFLLVATLCCCFTSLQAQEQLSTILERGHVAHWLVCGPFTSDLDGGIVAAVQRGEAPLGTRDHMKPVGGVARLRPVHKQAVRTDDGDAYWQQAGTATPTLDLAPFFPEREEGVSYAAFYLQAGARTSVYFDLHTALGARIWLNGFPFRDIQMRPIDEMGVDRFLVTFRPGKNLVLMELPGARYEALARATQQTARKLTADAFANRTLLQGKSGFEIGLKVRPAMPLDSLYYVPQLENKGTFSGMASDVRQDTELVFFNPEASFSKQIQLSWTSPGMAEPVQQTTPPIPPESEWKETLRLPLGERIAGQAINASVQLALNEATGSFDDTVPVVPRVPGGRVYVVHGRHKAPSVPVPQSEATELRTASMVEQLILSEREPEYGFDLGTVSDWKPLLDARPELRNQVLQSVALGRSAAQAAFAPVDERLVDGEILWRNIAYGIAAAQGQLKDASPMYYAWDTPGIAPQTAQVVRKLGLPGMISNLASTGIPPLATQLALDGEGLWHRHKISSDGPTTEMALRDSIALQRRELLDLGINTDVLVTESVAPPPEAYLIGQVKPLSMAYPAIRLEASGGRAFFEDLNRSQQTTQANVPVSARTLVAHAPGSIIAQPELKQAHAALTAQLQATERFATFAALMGAHYPEIALDTAWRQLLYNSTPDRLGIAATPEAYLDTLAGLRQAAELTQESLGLTLAYLAQEIDTDKAPVRGIRGVSALIVFNPCNWERDDVCEADIHLDSAVGLTLLDETGITVPYVILETRFDTNSMLRGARIRFIAKRIPSMGYRTYYIQPEGSLPETTEDTAPGIQNEFYSLEIDPATGDILQLVDKISGMAYATEGLNQVLLLNEYTERNGDGHELWTSGKALIAEEIPLAILREQLPTAERIRVTAPYAGGTLTRTLTLWQGIPRVDCSLSVEDIDLQDQVLLVRHHTPDTGRAPVFGERFGALTGSRSRGALDFRTAGMENPAGAALYPALHWSALSPNDHFRIDSERAVPLAPALVIHGNDPVLQRAAATLAAALIRRGIPASLMPDTLAKPDFLWSDSTMPTAYNQELDQGIRLRLVVGGPGQNAYAEALLAHLPKAQKDTFQARIAQGAVMLTADDRVPEGYAAVPTLLIAGFTPEDSAGQVQPIAESIQATGVYALASAFMEGLESSPIPHSGLAILHQGAGLSGVDADGAMLHLLAHERAQASPMLPAPDRDHHFRYALYPFENDWRMAGVPQAARAYAQPLHAHQTDLHLGHYPATQALLDITPEGFILTAVKPAGDGRAALNSEAPHPRNGVIVRGYDATGEGWKGRVSLFLPLSDAAVADHREMPVQRLPFEDRSVSHRADGFSIETLWLLSPTHFALGKRLPLERVEHPYGALNTRYWGQHEGPAPMGALPVSVALTGNIQSDHPTITATVANQFRNTSIEGVLYLHCSTNWQVAPEQHYYKLNPGDHKSVSIAIPRVLEASSTGGITAWTYLGDQMIRDSLEELETPVEVTLTRNEAQIRVQLRNHSGIAAEGFADLIALPAHWNELDLDQGSIVMPGRAAVSIAPFGTQEVFFRLSDPGATPWMALKVASNGRVQYHTIGPSPH